MMITPLDESKPSISARSWFNVCSRSSWPPAKPLAPARVLPMASSSSMNTMQGAFSFACSKRSRTREAPTPPNISTNSEPDREKKEGPARPAGDGAGGRCFAGPGRTYGARALGNAAAQALVLFGFFQEAPPLHELVLGLAPPRHVGEGRLQLLPVVDLGLGAAK